MSPLGVAGDPGRRDRYIRGAAAAAWLRQDGERGRFRTKGGRGPAGPRPVAGEEGLVGGREATAEDPEGIGSWKAPGAFLGSLRLIRSGSGAPGAILEECGAVWARHATRVRAFAFFRSGGLGAQPPRERALRASPPLAVRNEGRSGGEYPLRRQARR